MLKKILFLSLLFALGACKEDTKTMGGMSGYWGGKVPPSITEEFDRLVRSPTNNGCLTGTRGDIGDSVDRGGGCVDFDEDFYNQRNSGQKMASEIRSYSGKKGPFIRYFGPLAVYVQQKTGYPASALLAQWADETGWGTSKQVRVNNNIGGHSCWKKNRGYKYPTKPPIPMYLTPRIDVSCTYKRPRGEGGRYMTFQNIREAALSQVYNILDNPGTERNYGEARLEVKKSFLKGKKPDPYKVIDGLDGYAAFPPNYQARLKAHIKRNNFERFDQLTICGE